MENIDEGLSRAAGHEGDVKTWEKSPAGKAFIAETEAREAREDEAREKSAKAPKAPEPKAEFSEAEDEDKAPEAESKKPAPKK